MRVCTGETISTGVRSPSKGYTHRPLNYAVPAIGYDDCETRMSLRRAAIRESFDLFLICVHCVFYKKWKAVGVRSCQGNNLGANLTVEDTHNCCGL